MRAQLGLFLGTFATLLAIINPLEALPVFLKLTEGKDEASHKRLARRSCFYAGLLALFFLVFGNLMLRIFGVPLSMVRIVGGIILMKIGFDLYSSPGDIAKVPSGGAGNVDPAFVPLAMPIMFGPGAIATLIGMTSLVTHSQIKVVTFIGLVAAIALTMWVTYQCLASAKKVMRRVGPMGIDAATRIVGFFVSAIGIGLIFHGAIEALQTYGVLAAKP